MSEGKAKVCLWRLVRSVEEQALHVQEMAPGVFWASCGLCHVHGPGTSRKEATQRLVHGPECSLHIVAETKKDFSHAAA